MISIENEDDLEAAIEQVRSLSSRKLTEGEEAYLDTLSILVEAYEDKHCEFPPPSDAAILQELLDSKGVAMADVAHNTGISKSTLSLIANGERPFSKSVIGTLADYFEVDRQTLTVNI